MTNFDITSAMPSKPIPRLSIRKEASEFRTGEVIAAGEIWVKGGGLRTRLSLKRRTGASRGRAPRLHFALNDYGSPNTYYHRIRPLIRNGSCLPATFRTLLYSRPVPFRPSRLSILLSNIPAYKGRPNGGDEPQKKICALQMLLSLTTSHPAKLFVLTRCGVKN